MAPAVVVLMNEALMDSPGPPAWLAVNMSEAGAFVKTPLASLSVPDSMRVIASAVPRLIESAVVSVSVNASPVLPVHDRMTSAPRAPAQSRIHK
jgi:hypothetical protein